MATQNSPPVCSYFKFGYCKHKEHCRKNHVNELFDKMECDISNCNLRHPKICKFYGEYRKCKFDPCMFRHVDQANDTDIQSLKKQNVKLLSSIEIIENDLKHLQTKIQESEEENR